MEFLKQRWQKALDAGAADRDAIDAEARAVFAAHGKRNPPCPSLKPRGNRDSAPNHPLPDPPRKGEGVEHALTEGAEEQAFTELCFLCDLLLHQSFDGYALYV